MPNIPHAQPHNFRWGEDPSRFVLDLDEFHRPRISVPGGPAFVWPVGTEGVRISGQATLAIHKYIGDQDVEVEVTHRDEERIQLSGTFPGHTAPAKIRALRDVIEARSPGRGKILRLPHVYPRVQYVFVESYDFDHQPDDRTRSFAYTIVFVKGGVGPRFRNAPLDDPRPNPTSDTKPKGRSGRVFVVKDGYRTLRRVSKKVYGNEKKWRRIYDLNKEQISQWAKRNKVPMNRVQWRNLPLGWKLRY